MKTGTLKAGLVAALLAACAVAPMMAAAQAPPGSPPAGARPPGGPGGPAGGGMAAFLMPGGPPTPFPVETYPDSWTHYQALRAKAGGPPAQLPDWKGIWNNSFSPVFGLPRSPRGGFPMPPAPPGIPTPEKPALTPLYNAKWEKKMDDAVAGKEWDPLSFCLPAGFPRFLTEPFLKEFVVTPDEVFMINEQQSEVRRIYTDGRGHIPDDDAYPLWEGDSIGFWSGDTLVVHTNNLKAGQYQRSQPDYSDQISTVEEMRLLDANTWEDRITIYDPPSLTKPWRLAFRMTKVDAKKEPNLRINMWSCEENNNVVQTKDGSTGFLLPGEPGYKNPNDLGAADTAEKKK